MISPQTPLFPPLEDGDVMTKNRKHSQYSYNPFFSFSDRRGMKRGSFVTILIQVLHNQIVSVVTKGFSTSPDLGLK